MLALALLLAAAPPAIAHGDWLAYDFREQRALPLKVDRAGVFGFGYTLDGRPISLKVEPREDGLALVGAADAGDVELRWLPAGAEGAWVWMEGRPWRARRLAKPGALEGLKAFPLDDALPELLAGEPWVLETATGFELLERARSRGKYARRAVVQRAGRGWIATVDDRPVAALAKTAPGWLAGAETAALERCREAQWRAKTALKAAYAAMKAMRGELGRYPAQLREAGWGPQGDLPYALRVVRADARGFLVEAEGIRAPVLGDTWTIDEAGALVAVSDGCG